MFFTTPRSHPSRFYWGQMLMEPHLFITTIRGGHMGAYLPRWLYEESVFKYFVWQSIICQLGNKPKILRTLKPFFIFLLFINYFSKYLNQFVKLFRLENKNSNIFPKIFKWQNSFLKLFSENHLNKISKPASLLWLNWVIMDSHSSIWVREREREREREKERKKLGAFQ